MESSVKLSVNRNRIPWYKRQYLVNSEMQGKFARSGVYIGLTSTTLSSGLLLWAFWSFNIWQGQRLPTPVLVIFAFVFVMNAASIYVAGVIATQKIAGPLYNLLLQFERLEQWNFQAHARFRTHDELHYVGFKFNNMVDKLRTRHDEIKKNADDIVKCIAAGDTAAAASSAQRLQDLLAQSQS